MAVQLRITAEAVLEQLGQQGFVVGESCQAIAYIAGWKDAHAAPQVARRTAVIRHRDDGGQVVSVVFQPAQHSRKAVTAANRDDARPFLTAAVLGHLIHQFLPRPQEGDEQSTVQAPNPGQDEANADSPEDQETQRASEKTKREERKHRQPPGFWGSPVNVQQ